MEQSPPQQLSTRSGGSLQTDLTGAAVCAALTVMAYVAVVDPLVQAQASQRVERTELSVRQERLTKQAAAVSLLAQDLANMKKAAAGLPEFTTVPPQQSNQRLADLTHLASEWGLTVDELRTAEPIPGDRFQIVPIHLSGSGTFQHCTSFLHRLRATFPDTAVSNLKIAKQPGMPPEHTMFRFQLAWYAAPAARASVAAASP